MDWINVNDRLPTKWDSFWVYDPRLDEVFLCEYSTGRKRWLSSFPEDITHWAEVIPPEGPKS